MSKINFYMLSLINLAISSLKQILLIKSIIYDLNYETLYYLGNLLRVTNLLLWLAEKVFHPNKTVLIARHIHTYLIGNITNESEKTKIMHVTHFKLRNYAKN